MAVETGAILDGTVVKLLKYGVIIALPEGQSGLIHISEIADEYVHQVSDYFREGDSVKVKVLGQREEGRYELSAKQAEARKPLEGAALRPAGPPRTSAPERGSGGGSFEERLTDFLKESNRKINELKRSRDGKRRGRR
ncbi:MAG: S1 RNA-binding domain-containing protein [Armatimonadetes bacterium]|nr:S1 RNA-binding domain-containing protein [Armatimonadota bacterium]